MYLIVIEAFDVAEVELYNWKLAVLFWIVGLSASCLYAYRTPIPIREVYNIVLQNLLWCRLFRCLYCFCSCALLLFFII